ncbi:SDR family NAD(P)-dependent oxidoreductase [Dactylosporangium darangshiense]|uniref:SDR family NAD(P)-dependent oxidoreductase n=1 Tax=Dactylosporangium darangshiense TaxID=579108 RepID=UPI0031EB62B3
MNLQKIVLVTGANKGLGRAAAERFAALGCTVLVAARDPRKGEEAAAALGAHFVALDVNDPGSIRAAATDVDKRFGRLDVLVNNAGISGSAQVPPQEAYDQIPSTVELDMVRSVFETNVFAVIAVTNAMLPLLRRSPAPRIVNLSSHAASMTITSAPEWRTAPLPQSAAYAPSKAALNALTVQYANELAKDGFLVNAAAPGFCATDINANTGTRTAAQGAEVVVHLATLADDGPTGGFFSDEGPMPW